jgi:hypothetical protein
MVQGLKRKPRFPGRISIPLKLFNLYLCSRAIVYFRFFSHLKLQCGYEDIVSINADHQNPD